MTKIGWMRTLGAAASAAALTLAASGANAQQVALTYDDLPVHGPLAAGETRIGLASKILGALADGGVTQAYGFVNGATIADAPDGEAMLRFWRAAGHPLANHTWAHTRLDDVTVDAFVADAAKGDAMLKALNGDGKPLWFRFPYLAEGETAEKRTAARAALKKRGYRFASVTIDFHDWAYNEPYVRCAAKGDTAAIELLEARYLASAEASLAHARQMSNAVYGRDIPYVLLLHVGPVTARMTPKLLASYKALGVGFVTLEEAQADPFYRADTEAGPSADRVTLDAAMGAKGLPVPPRDWSTARLDALCR